MKTLFTTPLLFLLCLTALGQITITSADMPSANDTLRYSNASIDTLILNNYNKTGPNRTWDFSKLKPTSQGVDAYKSSLQTPYAFFFIGLNKYGLKVADSFGFGTFKFEDIYNFYQKSASSFVTEGMGMKFSSIPIPSYFTDKDEIYTFPLDYGDRDSTTFYFKTTVPGVFDFIRAGYRINTVDGYGTIITPFGSFPCLRIKTLIVEIDSIKTTTIKFGFPLQQTEIKWLANNIEIPVLMISGTNTMGNFTPAAARYRDSYRAAPAADFVADKLIAKPNDTISFTNLSAGYLNTYQWTITPGTFTYTGGTTAKSTDPQVQFNQPGLYNIKLRATSSLGFNEKTKNAYINILDPTGISTLSPVPGIKVYPNPVSGQAIYLQTGFSVPSDTEIFMLDQNGKQLGLIWKGHIPPGNQVQAISLQNDLEKGVYFLKAVSGTGSSVTMLLIN